LSVTEKQFHKGLAILGVAYNREITNAITEVYSGAIEGEFGSDEEWLATVRKVIKTSRYFPSPAELLEGLVESDAALEQEALALVDRLHPECWVYNPVSGGNYDAALVRDRLGVAALTSFRAAGGSRAFAAEDEKVVSFARRDFVKSYIQSRKAERVEERRQLGAGTDPHGQLVTGERRRNDPDRKNSTYAES